MKKMNSLNFGVCRQLLKHKDFYQKQVVPFLRETPVSAHKSCRLLTKQMQATVLGADGSVNSLHSAIQHPKGDLKTAFDAFSLLNSIHTRLEKTEHKSLIDVKYDLEVGDVVRHVHLGHIGVVAARLPVCLESDEWVVENLGFINDERLRHPWYLVLVARHQGLPLNFIRYGSQLTHRRLDVPRSVGFHCHLPLYFSGYDPVKGQYIAKGAPKPSTMIPLEVSLEEPAPIPVVSSAPLQRQGEEAATVEL